MICLDGLTVGLVVSYDRLREGDTNVLDCHFVVLIGSGHASQMRAQVLESLVVMLGQLAQ